MRDQEKVAKPPQLAQTGWCGIQEFLDHTTPAFGHPSCCSGGEFA